MMKKLYIAFVVLLALLFAWDVSAQDNTNVLRHNINYHVDSVNMWNGNAATFLDFDYNLIDLCLGEGCDNDPSIHEVFGTELVGIHLDFNLFMYLNSTFSIHGFSSGYVGVDYPVEIVLDFPDDDGFDHGQTVPIHSRYTVQDGWALNTHFPTAGTISLDLEYGFGADLSVSVEAMGSTVVDPIHLIPEFSFPADPQLTTPVPHDSIAVLYLNAETGEYAYPWIDEDTGMPYINTGFLGNGDSLVIEIPDAFGIGITADITIPYVETEDRLEGQCLYAEGQDDWFYMHWNLMQFIRFIGNAVGHPEVGEIVDILEGQTITYPIYEDYVVTIEYYILHANLEMTMALVQEFSFCPEISATMRFATPLRYYERTTAGQVLQNGESDEITFTVNNDLYITYPCYGWDSLQVYDVVYNIHSGFTNHTYNNLRVGLDLQVLHLHVNVPGLDDLFSVVTIPDFQLPDIEGGYENPEDAMAQSYDMAGIDVTRYSDAPPTREAERDIDFCIPTDCGALIDESFDLFDVDLDFLGVDLEWDLQFPSNMYNVTFPGTWLRPRPQLALNVQTSNVVCYGDTTGAINVQAINGAPNYIWMYSNGTTNITTEPNDMINVAAGYYYVTLSDTYGCTVAGEANILEANTPIESRTRVDNVLCTGESTGNLYVSVYGGVPPYSYEWSNGSTQQNVYGVPAGTYTVTITDAVGCIHEDQAVVTEPETLISITDAELQHISCYGMSDGHIDISVIGGTPAYTYYWSNGASVQDLHGIPAGSYTVTITDANGCFLISTYVIEQPDQLMLTLDSRDVRCYAGNTGSIDLTVEGGTEPYTIEWSNGATTEDLSELYAGFYIVTVTDDHGCVEYAMAEIRQPALPLHAEIEPINVRCYGEGNGVCDLNVFGGTPPYYYSWNTGAISEDIENLVPGFYAVTVTDENGCVSYDTASIYQSEYPISGYISGTDASCNGYSDGNVTFSVDGGTEPYHYEWSNGLWQQNLNNVPAGTYTVTVTDANFCHEEFSYVVGEPEPFFMQIMDDLTICYGMTTQIGLGIVSGGVPPYTILWSNGESGMSTNVTPLETTTYYASVVDAANCSSVEADVTVTVNPPLSANIELMSDSVVCPGSRVMFNAEITGGGLTEDIVCVNGDTVKMPYSPIVESDTVFNFVIYDNCHYDSVYIPISIATYEELPVDVSYDIVEGCAPLTVSFSENTPNSSQTYLWNFDDGDFENMSFAKAPKHTFYNSGVYNVSLEVTSAHGCMRDTTVTVTVFSIPEADFRVDRANISMSSPIVNFTNYSHGGFWNSWDFGDNTTSTSSSPVHAYTMPGSYHVVLTTTSLYGCTDTAGVDIQVSNEHNIFAPTAFTPNADEINDTFRIFGTSIDQNTYSIVIYDRWGAVQFKSSNFEEEWDGTDGTRPCPEGLYTWRIYYRDMFGIDYEDTGTVMLIR